MVAHSGGTLLVLALLLLAAPAQALSEAECRQDAEALLQDIERNRQQSGQQYQQAIDAAGSDQERATIKAQMEQIWQDEEQQRAMADQMLRDCLRFVQTLKQQANTI